MSRYRRLAWAALTATGAVAVTWLITGAVATASPAVSTASDSAGQRTDAAFIGPSMIWRLTKTADRAVVQPGQRITYTIVLQQLQSPFSLAARLCLASPNRPDCEAANTILLSQPLIVDDLSAVTAHATFDNDAKGVPGTIVRVQTRAGGTVIMAEPDTAVPGVTRLRFTFSVTVKDHTKPGTAIGNTAYVSVHTAFVPAPGPLTNCSLDTVFTGAHGVVPSACTAFSVIPPAKGGAQTGFGGMAGRVGNIGHWR
jgi:hypothetical protein